MITVLLVDDHPVVRSGYSRLLEQQSDIRIVAEAGDVEAGYAAFLASRPQVCATDLSLPGAGGLDLLHRILARDATARVVIFSMFDSAPLVRRAIERGASGFVSKKSSPGCLAAAVRAVHGGTRYLSPDLPATLLRTTRDDESQRLASLSQREFEVFRLLAEGRSPLECAGILNLSPKTVANHQTQIKDKLAVSTSAALVHLALRNGVLMHHKA